MNKLLLCGFLLICFFSSSAQEFTQRCHSEEKMQEMAEKDPEYAKALKEFLARPVVTERNSSFAGTIPVHVIIVHSPGESVGTGNNFSLAHVQSQIDVLNQDFSNTNADAGNTPPQFSSVSTGIQFCLATVDPDGNATDGITRYPSTQDFNSNEQSIKLATTWDHNSYMNIWSAELGGGLLGYAYFPGAGPSQDGVVITSGAFGGPGFGTFSPYDLGRTATHEVGHYLGLNHVWGAGGGGCGMDDGFSDTPTQSGSNGGCPSHPSPSCGNSGDMFMNYMDYVNDNCMNAFTAEQSAEMNSVLSGSRSGLLAGSFTNCAAVVPMSAQITLSGDPLCFQEFTGFIEIEASGGQAPITYSLNGGTQQSSGFFPDLGAGAYVVEAFDSGGQSVDIPITLFDPNPLEVFSIDQQDALCNGDNTGFLEVNASGGASSGQYVYSFENGPFTSQNFYDNLSAGTYEVVVADVNDCTQTATFEVNEAEALTPEDSDITNNLCADATDGVITINISGGTGDLSYAIMGQSGSDENTFTDLPNGMINIIVTDANACTEMITETVTSPPALTLEVDNTTDILCPGDSSIVTLMGAGGLGELMYSYSADSSSYQMSPIFEGVIAGDYNFYIQDENACVTTIMGSITQPTPTVVTTESQTDVECFGDYSGTVQLSAEGAGMITYTLNGISNTTGFFDNLTSESYTFTTTDANSCTSEYSIEIAQSSTLDIQVADVADVICNNENNGTLSIDAIGGAGDYTYSINGSTFTTQTEYTGLEAGAYSIIVQDLSGCQALSEIEISQPDALAFMQMDAIDIACAGETNGMIFVTGTGGTGTLTYSLDGVDNATGVFENLGAGDYDILITDSNNCTTTTSLNIDEPTVLDIGIDAIIDSNCDGDPIGSVNVTANGGTGTLSYSLNGEINNTGIFENLTDGMYTVMVTDESGCSNDVMAIVAATTDIQTTVQMQSQPSCSDAIDGSIQLQANGGNGTFTFGLNGQSNTTGVFDNLGEGSYTAVITDADGCFNTYAFEITAPDELTISSSDAAAPTCNNGTDGVFQAGASGGTGTISYTLNGQTNTTGTFNNLASGQYDLLIVDTNNCSSALSVEIPETMPVVTNVEGVTDVDCFDGSNGSATISANAGNGPYQYTVDGSTNTNGVFTNLQAGDYDVLVTDASGCTSMSNFTIDQGLEIATQVESVEDIVCFGESDGSFQISASGNGNSYTYTLDQESNDNGAFANLSAGTYEVVVTNISGCTSLASVTLDQGDEIVIDDIDAIDNSCNDSNDASINLQATNAVGTVTYTLGAESNNIGSFENLEADSYDINITDANGCSTTTNVTVANPDTIALTVVPCSDFDACDFDSYIVVATGGTAPYEFSNDGGAVFQPEGEFDSVADGIYNIAVVDENGCTQSLTYDFSTVMIDENDPRLQQEKLYPVPTSDMLTLEFVLNGDQDVEFTTLDIRGRVIGKAAGSYVRGFNTFTMDVSDYASAVYVLAVKNRSEIRYYKFNKVDL